MMKLMHILLDFTIKKYQLKKKQQNNSQGAGDDSPAPFSFAPLFI